VIEVIRKHPSLSSVGMRPAALLPLPIGKPHEETCETVLLASLEKGIYRNIVSVLYIELGAP
jgi:hypothetical protein